MNAANGFYLNLYEDKSHGMGRDIFILFNEANSEPTADELERVQEAVEVVLSQEDYGNDEQLRKYIRYAVEDLPCECVEFGVQVAVIK